jgi:hypothetical protein
MTLINDNELNNNYKVKILSIEKGYNKEFQTYNIIIVDKPVHRKYKIIAQISQSNKLELNRNITSYKGYIYIHIFLYISLFIYL